MPGKGENGRQERPAVRGDTAAVKPHPEQGQKGGFKGEPDPSAGRPQDPGGNAALAGSLRKEGWAR